MSKGGKSAGFGSAAAVIILIIIAVNVIGGNKTEIGKSTVKREKLENTVSVQTEYYTDELGWVEAPSDLEEGMKAFSCLLYTSPSPRDGLLSRMPSSA